MALEQLLKEFVDQDLKRDKFARLQLQREMRRLQDSLLDFVKEAWAIVEPEHPFSMNWHIAELCKVLEQMTLHKEGKADAEAIQRLIVNVPPGTMKSLLVSVFWPCWVWARNGKLNILTVAYSDKRALDANLKARKILQSAWFQKYFPLKLTEDSNTKGRYDVKNGGWRIATSVGGEGTGLHPDFIIIDDASTATDAQSETERKAVTDWFQNTISSRGVSRSVSLVVIGQRLDAGDLTGYLLASENAPSWTLVCWPMRYEPSRAETEKDKGWKSDPRDPRTEPGQLLWPELYDEKKVRQMEIDLAEDAPGQLQQNPSPKGGRLFKVEEFKFYDAPPAVMRKVRGWDTGGTEGGGDPTVGALIGEEMSDRIVNGRRNVETTGRLFVLDIVSGQWGPEGVDKSIQTTAKIDGTGVSIREQREGGSSGKAVTNIRAKSLRGYDYAEVLIGTNKVQFSKSFRAQVNAGNVYLPTNASWVKAFVRELEEFPAGKHDDQVDAIATAYNSLATAEVEEFTDIGDGDNTGLEGIEVDF